MEVFFAELRVFRHFPHISALLRLAMAIDDIHRHFDAFTTIRSRLVMLTRAPLGSAEQRAPLGGGHFGPPEISRTSQRSDKRQTALDSPWLELSKAYKFLKIKVTGQVKLRSKIKYYSF